MSVDCINGGQIPNTLTSKLAKENVKFIASNPNFIDKAENREKFSALLDKLGIKQPLWKRLKSKREALSFARTIGFPVLIRPSYVLSGKAMFVAYSDNVLSNFLKSSRSIINSEYPVVISKFIRGVREVDFDAVCDMGKIIVYAISEHVENSGVHSGDATLVLPSFSISEMAVKKINSVSLKITNALNVTGPINIQYLVKEEKNIDPEVMVIEANLRASRSFPFVSKVLGINFIELATKIMLGEKVAVQPFKKLNYVGIKNPHFSFTRLRQADPVLRVEMASTGEVACFGDDIYEAYLKAVLSTGTPLPTKAALLSLGGMEGKMKLLPSAILLRKLGFTLYATRNTAEFLNYYGLDVKNVYKVHEDERPNVLDLINEERVSLVINISDRDDLGIKELTKQVSDGYLIRRAAVDTNIPLFTKATIANLFVNSLVRYNEDTLKIKSWDEYVK